jgi:hypothetical protein
MANLYPRNLGQISSNNPELGAALQDIVNAINNHAEQSNAAPVGENPVPVGHAKLEVSGGGGYFSVRIHDNSPSFRGKENFISVAQENDRGFASAHKIHLGASKTWFGYLGNKKLHFASYPSYPTTGPAPPVFAMDVDGNGTTVPDPPGEPEAMDGFGRARFNTPQTPSRG